MRDAALVCVGMSEFLGQKIYFSPSEKQDYDFVAKYSDSSKLNYYPRQLKELVSAELNPESSIQAIVSKLTSHADLSSINVAIRLNRETRFEPAKLSVPNNLKIGDLWVYGSISQDRNEWCLWGDFCSGVVNVGTVYAYPSR